MRRSLVVLVALATAFALAVPVGAEFTFQVSDDLEPYIVVMDDQPVVAYDGGLPGLAPTEPAEGEKVDTDSNAVEEYQEYLEQERERTQEAAGIDESQVINTYDFVLVGFSAALTPEEAERLRVQKGVVSVTRDELRQLHTDTSGDFLDLTGRGGAYDSGINGEGVVVGIIDTGIWPEHPSFSDDGSYSTPPVSIEEVDLDPGPGENFVPGCDFGDVSHNPDDEPFECNNKLIGARDMRTLYNALIGPELYDSARDADGHGSHTAGTAAGNANVRAEIFDIKRGRISGIAPRAHIVVYKGCGDQGCFGGDLADAIDQAVADGVDVINYSIGSNSPGLTGPDDIAFLLAADAGVHVATSNGNSGPGTSTVGSPASVPWLTSVGASHHSRMFRGSIRLGNGERYFGASVTHGVGRATLVDGAALGNELCDPGVTFDPAPVGQIVLCKGAVGRAAKSHAVLDQGGVGMILYNDAPNQTLPSDNHYVPTVHVTNADGLEIKEYIADEGEDARATLTKGVAVKRENAPYMAYFSSRGPVGSPASSDIIKPDVTAPGVQILAANSPAGGVEALGRRVGAIQGTSMSSPHVAGLLALLDQANPDWSPAAAKSALMTTAYQDVYKEDQVTPADPFDMGAGHVDGDLNNRGRRKWDDRNAAQSMFNPGLVYDAGTSEYFGFLCDAAPEVFIDPVALCADLEEAGVPTSTENLNYPSIGASEVPGTLTVTRSVTNVSKNTLRVRADIDEPDGFDVSVSPRRLTVAPGDTVSFEITFENEDAPIGDWRFGSLTWKGRGYEVRSPIAVAASSLDAPGAVSGTGVDGSTSFDVTFGYNGEYDATAHGLAPDVAVAGEVGDDPDQSFDPTDPTGTTSHEITLSGTAFWRLTLDTDDLVPPNSAIDLDLYMYSQDGELVAISGAGGTAELIELTEPEDGVYTLFVHGWETTGLTVEYSAHTWDVPLEADSGSLAVTTEPEDAVLGATETIVAEWSGLDAGTSYLGAVGHNDSEGLFDLTLVEVDT